MSAGLFIYGIILMVMGYREINATKTYPTDFSYAIVVLLYGPIIYYFLGGTITELPASCIYAQLTSNTRSGVFCFSWNLPTFKPTQVVQERDPFATLKTVRLINDVSMGLILLLCIAELAIIIPLKASPYNNQCACLFGTSILFIENTFETATNSMRGKNPFSGSSHRPGNNQSTSFLGSKTGGKSANVSVRAGLNRHNNVPPPLDPLSGKPVLAHPAHMGPTSTYASGEADVEADHTQSIT
ncbi:hypothetical protein HKX48_008261 [Thoreauomyces humboldtii]|nr:hypothetical protein HKX48_008261 [Thoreauomyces humboldtii]